MLSDDRYLAGETSGIAPRHIPFLPGAGKESMPAMRQRGENRNLLAIRRQPQYIPVTLT